MNMSHKVICQIEGVGVLWSLGYQTGQEIISTVNMGGISVPKNHIVQIIMKRKYSKKGSKKAT